MNFNKHFHLEGRHSFLSASQSSWVNYDDEKLRETFKRRQAAAQGTRIHEWASEAIKLGFKQPRSKKTINSFINDCIGFRMNTEVLLYYSDNAFGTADAISFKKNLLRIYDLKTGVVPANERQLYVYCAYFCLEYGINPNDIEIDLRIYQSDEIIQCDPPREDILYIMRRIVESDVIIEGLLVEEV